MLTVDSDNDSLNDNALDNEILQIENSSESSYFSDSSEYGIELCQCDGFKNRTGSDLSVGPVQP